MSFAVGKDTGSSSSHCQWHSHFSIYLRKRLTRSMNKDGNKDGSRCVRIFMCMKECTAHPPKDAGLAHAWHQPRPPIPGHPPPQITQAQSPAALSATTKSLVVGHCPAKHHAEAAKRAATQSNNIKMLYIKVNGHSLILYNDLCSESFVPYVYSKNLNMKSSLQ